MTEDLLTPTDAPDSAADDAVPGADPLGLSDSASQQLGVDDGQSDAASPPAELGEEYRPYSQFPWHEIPEHVRSEMLQKLKQFHGDMTRGSQEVADLKRQTHEFQQKAQWFDELTNQDWFQRAYLAHQQGQTAPQAPQQQTQQTLKQLSDYGIDQEAGSLIEQHIQSEVARRMQPVAERMENLQRQMVQDQTDRELAALRTMATEKGWPSPDEKLSEMSQLIQSGRARTARDAYQLAIFEDVPKITEKAARSSLQSELQRKAQSTLPPTTGPSHAPGEEMYTGPDAVRRAFDATLAELAGRQQQR